MLLVIECCRAKSIPILLLNKELHEITGFDIHLIIVYKIAKGALKLKNNFPYFSDLKVLYLNFSGFFWPLYSIPRNCLTLT